MNKKNSVLFMVVFAIISVSVTAQNKPLRKKSEMVAGDRKKSVQKSSGVAIRNSESRRSFDVLLDSDLAMENTLVGTFYDLKKTAEGNPAPMNIVKFNHVVSTFVESWKEKDLEGYYQVPEKRNAICLVMPVMDSNMAPAAFGVADLVSPRLWVIHYKGEITAPETGRYRFCGEADDFLMVRVRRKLVLDASFPSYRMCDWESSAKETGKFPLANQMATYGDWIRLRKGQTVPIEVLLSDGVGGKFSCHLFIEQEGKVYRKVRGRSILPIFKMAEIPDGLEELMELDPDIATVEGPVFGKGR